MLVFVVSEPGASFRVVRPSPLTIVPPSAPMSLATTGPPDEPPDGLLVLELHAAASAVKRAASAKMERTCMIHT